MLASSHEHIHFGKGKKNYDLYTLITIAIGANNLCHAERERKNPLLMGIITIISDNIYSNVVYTNACVRSSQST